MMMTSVFRFCWRALVFGALISVVACQSDVPAKEKADGAEMTAAEAEALRGVVTDGTPQEMTEAAIARNRETIKALRRFRPV
ncbi:MAG: hypothetical protein IPH12_13560 [Saprospirales bacterium]|nr:hypothetical protein [Saprospirales bacterium]